MEVDREGLRGDGSEGGEGKRSSGRGEGSLMGGGGNGAMGGWSWERTVWE